MFVLLNLIAWLVIFGLCWWAIKSSIPMNDPVPKIIDIVFLILVIGSALGAVGAPIGFTLPRLL